MGDGEEASWDHHTSHRGCRLKLGVGGTWTKDDDLLVGNMALQETAQTPAKPLSTLVPGSPCFCTERANRSQIHFKADDQYFCSALNLECRAMTICQSENSFKRNSKEFCNLFVFCRM